MMQKYQILRLNTTSDYNKFTYNILEAKIKKIIY